MTITVLVENTAVSEELGAEHGLSILIQMPEAVILFDAGCGGLFVENAKKLGLELAEVTHLILSHGHYDHGGGLPAFLEANSRARIFLREEALGATCAVRENGDVDYIGLPEAIKGHPRLTITHNGMRIAPGITLYSDIQAREPIPATNRGLMMRQGDEMLPDTFSHEQIAEIRNGGKTLLLTGCSHHGISNILRHYQDETKRAPDMIIGGFHLHSHRFGRAEDAEIDRTVEVLAQTGAVAYTCHCTGLPAYEALKEKLGERLNYLSGGQTINL